jgi:two-component system, OmpR family, sensor histidine kinase MprB
MAVALGAGATYVQASHLVYAQAEQSLRSLALDSVTGPNVDFPQPSNPLLGSRYFQFLSSDGTISRPAQERIALPITEGDLEVARGMRSSNLVEARVNGVHVLIYTLPFEAGSAIQVERSLRDEDDVVSALGLALLLVVVAGIIVGAVVGRIVASTAVAPLRVLHRAAAEVASTQDLTRRVPTGSRDIIGQLAASFNAMLVALERASEAQRRIIADASHELRTPLASIRANAELLRHPGLKPLQRHEVESRLVEEAEELTTLVNNLIDLERGDHVAPAMADTRLDLVVRAAIDEAQRRWPGVAFRAELSPSLVLANDQLLHRALLNVLDNAAKWSPPDGWIEVRSHQGEVVISDRGPGIAPEDVSHIFERFWRSAGARGKPGSGLGLAIVKQIADAHGAKIEIETRPPQGTSFRLSLKPGTSHGDRPQRL